MFAKQDVKPCLDSDILKRFLGVRRMSFKLKVAPCQLNPCYKYKPFTLSPASKSACSFS